MDLGRLILRVTIGGLMLLHGIGKIRHGIGGVSADLVARGLPSVLGYLVYVGEVVAPLLVLLGLFTRPAAVVIFINMVVAVWLAHMGMVWSLNKGGGWALELNALFGFGALAIALLGTGRYAVMNGMSRWS